MTKNQTLRDLLDARSATLKVEARSAGNIFSTLQNSLDNSARSGTSLNSVRSDYPRKRKALSGLGLQLPNVSSDLRFMSFVACLIVVLGIFLFGYDLKTAAYNVDAFQEGVSKIAVNEFASSTPINKANYELCSKDNSLPCYELGRAAQKASNLIVARYFHTLACENDHAAACRQLAHGFYEGGSLGTDYIKAVEYYRAGCELGDGKSCYYVGDALMSGEGVERDKSSADKLFMKACHLGEARSCVTIAWLRKNTVWARLDGRSYGCADTSDCLKRAYELYDCLSGCSAEDSKIYSAIKDAEFNEDVFFQGQPNGKGYWSWPKRWISN